MEIRERIEKIEEITLCPGAQLSSKSLGREGDDKLDNIRTCYMVDRDRIIHSKSFRRLKRKTQVYIRTASDHYRTRLTHTLEVSQIARTIAIAIGLNESLVEAIALGHDLGHVAFAHTGEEVLDKFLPEGFKHNEQSVRVVRLLENKGRGLNLTKEVLDGILNHSGFSNGNAKACTMEGQVVRYADKIAYINHDIDDSIRANLLSESDLPKDIIELLGSTKTERISTLVNDCVKNSIENIKKGIYKISLSDKVGDGLTNLRRFMFDNIYLGEFLHKERFKAKFILENMLEYYCSNINLMPDFYKSICDKEGVKRGVADYIAGMTDDYCTDKFNEIYVPKFVIY